MAAFSIVIETDSGTSATQLAQSLDKTGKRQAVRAMRDLLRKVASGNQPAYVTTQVASAFASGTITCTNSSAVNATDTTTIAGTALALVASPSTESQFAKGATDATMATALAACINAHATLQKIVRAKAATNVVTVTSKVPGPIGNLITLAETGNGMVISGAALTAGASDEADSFAFGFDATV